MKPPLGWKDEARRIACSTSSLDIHAALPACCAGKPHIVVIDWSNDYL
jgi:hypothetical protein